MRRFACLSRACLGFVMLLPAAFAAENTPPPAATQPAVPEVAIMIVYDTSGSMTQTIPTKNKGLEAKHVIGKRALAAVGERLKAFNANSGKKASLGVVVFNQNLPLKPLLFRSLTPHNFRPDWPVCPSRKIPRR